MTYTPTQRRAMEYLPKPEEELLRQLPDALAVIHNPKLKQAEVDPVNFFDFPNGVRAIISRIRLPNGPIYTQASFLMAPTTLKLREMPPAEMDAFAARICKEWFPDLGVCTAHPDNDKRVFHVLLHREAPTRPSWRKPEGDTEPDDDDNVIVGTEFANAS